MSLLEVIGEWIAPGRMGRIGVHAREHPLPATWLVLVRSAVSIAALTPVLVWLGEAHGLGATLGFLAYVLVATVLRPDPDYGNVGLLGGLMNDPFRISDNYNRFLIALLVVLLPGRIIGGGLVLLLRWLAAAAARGR